MPDPSLTASIKKPSGLAHFAPAREGSRRSGNALGSPGRQTDGATLQPQDGVTRSLTAEIRTLQLRIAARITGSKPADPRLVSKVLSEPEDARLTGGTRSLMRRILGLNVPKTPRKSETLRPARVA